MADENKTLKNIYKVTRKQYSKLAYEDGVIGSGDGAHRFDPDALYLVEDTIGSGGGGGDISAGGQLTGPIVLCQGRDQGLLMPNNSFIQWADEEQHNHVIIRTSGECAGDGAWIDIGDSDITHDLYLYGEAVYVNDTELQIASEGNAIAGTTVSRYGPGTIQSEKYAICNEEATTQATIQYDSTLKAIKFVFNNK